MLYPNDDVDDYANGRFVPYAVSLRSIFDFSLSLLLLLTRAQCCVPTHLDNLGAAGHNTFRKSRKSSKPPPGSLVSKSAGFIRHIQKIHWADNLWSNYAYAQANT